MKNTTKEIMSRLEDKNIVADKDRPFVWVVGGHHITASDLKAMLKVQEEREADFAASDF